MTTQTLLPPRMYDEVAALGYCMDYFVRLPTDAERLLAARKAANKQRASREYQLLRAGYSLPAPSRGPRHA